MGVRSLDSLPVAATLGSYHFAEPSVVADRQRSVLCLGPVQYVGPGLTKRTCCGGDPTGDLGLGGIWNLRRGILGTPRWPWISGYLGPGRKAETPRRWPLHQDRSWPGNPGGTGCRIWIRKIQHSQQTPTRMGWTRLGMIGRLCGFRVTAPLKLFYLVGRILQLPPSNRRPHRRLPEPCGRLAGPCARSSWYPGLRGISALCSPDTGS